MRSCLQKYPRIEDVFCRQAPRACSFLYTRSNHASAVFAFVSFQTCVPQMSAAWLLQEGGAVAPDRLVRTPAERSGRLRSLDRWCPRRQGISRRLIGDTIEEEGAESGGEPDIWGTRKLRFSKRLIIIYTSSRGYISTMYPHLYSLPPLSRPGSTFSLTQLATAQIDRRSAARLP